MWNCRPLQKNMNRPVECGGFSKGEAINISVNYKPIRGFV
jgi:hypothetical protein